MLDSIIKDDTLPEDSNQSDLSKPGFRSRLTGPRVRWITLLFISLSCFGVTYCYNIPQSLQSDMYSITDSDFKFNLLYSVYSFSNIIIPFIGGVIIDRLGLRLAFAIFSSLVWIGQCILTLGFYKSNLAIILAGRAVYALGGETTVVAQSAMITKWFRNKELSFALGIAFCISRLGISLGCFISPRIYGWAGNQLYVPYFIGAILAFLSFLTVLITNFVDKGVDLQRRPNSSTVIGPTKIVFPDLKKLGFVYYILLLNCAFIYSGFFGLVINLNNQMQERFGFSSVNAADFMPIIYIFPILLTPILGKIADNRGKRIRMIIIGSVLLFLSNMFFSFLPDSPNSPNYAVIGGLIGIGLFYCLYAAGFWPCIALVVEEKLVGIAYGIMYSFQNFVLSFLPMIVGKIHDETTLKDAGYFWTEVMLTAISAFGIISSLWLHVVDRQKGSDLDKPTPSLAKV